MTDDYIVLFLLAILIVGAGLFAVILLSKRSGRKHNVAKYQSQWLKIENSLQKENTATYQLSILQADKLIDTALREKGIKGNTMGERMKAAQSIWKNPDHIWGAHKIRNRIAHEADAEVTHDIAARSLAAYRQALKDLGAI